MSGINEASLNTESEQLVARFDIAIVGGGIVGASLALALKDAALSVAVVEPQPPTPFAHDTSWDRRVYTVSPGNARWLKELGVWDCLPADRITRVENMYVYGDREPGRLEFSAYDSGMRELAFVVENRELQEALWLALERSGHISLYRAVRCAHVAWKRECVRLVLTDGAQLSTRLVVGADGADSWVRARAGIPERLHDYRQRGVVANFSTGREHEGAAFQWFRHDGVLALLPLPGKRVSMVWSAPDARAQALLAASPDALCAEVERASAGALGGLRLITTPASFALKRQRAQRLVEPRAALIGDAAHNIHPLAGQGVNLGLRDARALADVMIQRGPYRDCGEYALLRRYERARKEDIIALELTTDGLEKLFGARSVMLAGLRNVGLSLVDAQPLLKNLFVRRAAG
jgi:ubiquinone biosynthesis UbiH/UbiF/VisC/COQ6 family hydroxylase